MHSNESFANVTKVSRYEFLTNSHDAVKMQCLLFYRHIICTVLLLLGLGNAAKAMKKKENISDAVNI